MLPQDPVILFSYLNTQLRDRYSTLSDLCDDLDVEEFSVLKKMEEAGYVYDRDRNCFKNK